VTIIAPLTRGDIVTSGRFHGVVWRVASGQVVILPVETLGDNPARRNDVPIGAWSDLAAMGIAARDLRIRPSLARRCGPDQTRLGVLPAHLLATVTAAVAREVSDLAVERDWHAAHAVRLRGGVR
jgi:hypothetical protein